MSDYPRVSDEALNLIEAVLFASGEEIGEAMHNLHRYIEALEKRRQPTTSAPAHTQKERET